MAPLTPLLPRSLLVSKANLSTLRTQAFTRDGEGLTMHDGFGAPVMTELLKESVYTDKDK